MFGLRARRRQRLRERAFPPEWRAFVERNVPYYGCLTADERRELEGLVQIFLAEKSFEGAGGLEITDDVMEGPQSVIWQQGENNMHGAAAILDFFLSP
jgi:Mlc titration factor MtfA (ptsG expression regulator)